MIKEITKSKFEERFPETRSDSRGTVVAYLENGVALLDIGWNGEEYIIDGKRYKPVFDLSTYTYHETTIGFEERS